MSGAARKRIALVGAAAAFTVLALLMILAPAPSATRPGVPAVLRQDDRAVALGLLLDTPVARPALDEGLRVAEALRRHFKIDTGNAVADRLAAAHRAETEVLEPLRATPSQVEGTARSLGYSLDPAQCSNYCENVYRLALLELHKRALEDFIAPEH